MRFNHFIQKSFALVFFEILYLLSGPENLFSQIRNQFSKIDQTFGKYISFLPVAIAHDQGLIAFFEKDCPEGWVPHVKSVGRLLKGTSFDSQTEQVGGANGHTLTIEQMPSHFHYMFTTQGTPVNHQVNLQSTTYKTSNPTDPYDYSIQGSDGVVTHGRLGFTGTNTPFSVVPSHVKLKICEKNSINAQYAQLVGLIQNMNNHIAEFNATVAHYEQMLEEYNYYSSQLEEIQDEFNSQKKYSPALHIVGIVALVFVLINIVFWVISCSKYSKAQKLINEIKADDAQRAIDSER